MSAQERKAPPDPEGEVAIALARERVAVQITGELTETTYGSSIAIIGKRVRTILEARGESDPHTVRAAAFDLAVAAAAYAAILDVELPDNAGQRRRRRPRASV